MLRIYTELSHYNPKQRIYLADILRPFLPNNRFNEFGIDDDIIKLVENIEDSDICLLPMAWNYYLNTNQVDKAKKIIHMAQSENKKILVWVKGDYFISIPNYDHLISMYYSTYQSKSTDNTVPLPVIIRDPLSFLELDTISLRAFNTTPSIGFCGQADSNMIISSIKTARLAWKNIKYFSHLSKFYPGTLTPPTYLRKKALNILDKTDKIITDFIPRDRYMGGESKNKCAIKRLKKDFFQNIENTDYTLCIRGTGNFSARLYETLALGRIPVFINTDCILPFNNEIDWKKHLVWVEINEINNIEEKIYTFHDSLTHNSFQLLQEENRMLWEKYFKFSGFFKQLSLYLKKELAN